MGGAVGKADDDENSSHANAALDQANEQAHKRLEVSSSRTRRHSTTAAMRGTLDSLGDLVT